MFTFEKNVRFTCRDPSTPLRKFVVSVMEFLYLQQALSYQGRTQALAQLKERPITWKRDRLAFIIGERLAYSQVSDVSRREQYIPPNGTKAVIVNMANGNMQTNHKLIGELDPGDAVVVMQRTSVPWRAGSRDDDVTIHIRSWSADDRVVEELSVIKDMVSVGDEREAQRLAKELLPFGWHMFMTLCARERTWNETKGFG